MNAGLWLSMAIGLASAAFVAAHQVITERRRAREAALSDRLIDMGAASVRMGANTAEFAQALATLGRSMTIPLAAFTNFGASARRAAMEAERRAELYLAAVREQRPVWGAHETANPVNQFLANHQARKRNALERIQAGNLERWYVRGAMDPAYADPRDRDAMVRELVTGGGYQAHALAARFLAGWVEHHEPADVCTCTMTDPKWWTTYGGATEPGSQWQWEPSCDVHGEDAPGCRMATCDTTRGRGYLLERRADAHPWAPWRQRFMLGVDQDPHEWPAFDYFGADL